MFKVFANKYKNNVLNMKKQNTFPFLIFLMCPPNLCYAKECAWNPKEMFPSSFETWFLVKILDYTSCIFTYTKSLIFLFLKIKCWKKCEKSKNIQIMLLGFNILTYDLMTQLQTLPLYKWAFMCFLLRPAWPPCCSETAGSQSLIQDSVSHIEQLPASASASQPPAS